MIRLISVRLPQRKKENMAFYEHVVIARQDISPQQAEALNEQLKTLIEVDGGVNKDNAPLLKKAGAEILVAGSSVFGKEDRAAAIRDLKV